MIFNLLMLLMQGQDLQKNHEEESYKKISGLFDAYGENDERALVYVQMFIEKAKKDRNYKKLIRGYEEAIYYNKNISTKLSYADSAIIIAKRYNDYDQISRAYLGKGIIYFFNRRQYKPALELYLTAYDFSKNSQDDYLKNKIIYHLGTVESYLGDYDEAVSHFQDAAAYYEENMVKAVHPNIKLNNKLGYFNSIYRLSTCYKNLRSYSKEDSLIKIGLERLQDTKDLSLEYGLFQKGRGIQLLRKNQLDEALKHLMIAKVILSHDQDYASLTTAYFYLGKLHIAKSNRKESLLYLNRVDSMVNKYHFITPEIRSAYEYLINDAKKNGNRDKKIYYMGQLLKADSVISADFVKFSSKIYREYDKERLLEEKEALEQEKNGGSILIYLSISATAISFILFIRYQKKAKDINIKYKALLEKYTNTPGSNIVDDNANISLGDKYEYSSEIITDVRIKLEKFEKDKLFLSKDLSVPRVAQMIGTNRNVLSSVLNDHMNITFTAYLKNLRIKYITNLMLEDSNYLKYTVDSLAEICGMANRKIFALHFKEVNGMKPSEFIQKRKEELKKANL